MVGEDDTFRATQFPIGSSRYKSFTNKVTREQTELQKQNEEGEVDIRRTQLYIDTIARHKVTLEKDLPALVPRITETHGALTAADLDNLHGYDNLLSPLIKEAMDAFTKLSLPASVNDPATLTPNVSMILGNGLQQQQAASSQHQPLPGALAFPPPGLATAGGAQPGQRGFYKPYREQDFPRFSGHVEEYGGWKREWQQKILPWLSPEVALRELNRCTPKNLDLSIYDEVDQIWRELGRLYGNPLTISSSIMDGFLDMKPHDIEGDTEELQFANLKKLICKLNSS